MKEKIYAWLVLIGIILVVSFIYANYMSYLSKEYPVIPQKENKVEMLKATKDTVRGYESIASMRKRGLDVDSIYVDTLRGR